MEPGINNGPCWAQPIKPPAEFRKPDLSPEKAKEYAAWKRMHFCRQEPRRSGCPIDRCPSPTGMAAAT